MNHNAYNVYVYNKLLYMQKMNPKVVHCLQNATDPDKEDFRQC